MERASPWWPGFIISLSLSFIVFLLVGCLFRWLQISLSSPFFVLSFFFFHSPMLYIIIISVYEIREWHDESAERSTFDLKEPSFFPFLSRTLSVATVFAKGPPSPPPQGGDHDDEPWWVDHWCYWMMLKIPSCSRTTSFYPPRGDFDVPVFDSLAGLLSLGHDSLRCSGSTM